MNEKTKAVEIQQEFELEFKKSLDQLVETFPRVSRVKKEEDLSDNVFKITLYTILLNSLKQVQIDCNMMSIKEFHTKYVPNLPILYRGDFTTEEFKEIIDSTYMKLRDKKIAHKFYVEKKTIQEIYDEMLTEVGDKKTINNNLEAINNSVLHRACIYNKEKGNN